MSDLDLRQVIAVYYTTLTSIIQLPQVENILCCFEF